MSELYWVMPEIIIASAATLILLLDVHLSNERRWLSYLIAQFAVLGAAIFSLRLQNVGPQISFNGGFVLQDFANVLKIFMFAVTSFVFVYSRSYLRTRNIYQGEYFALCLYSLLGMMVLVSAGNFLTLYLGVELLALPLYALIALARDQDNVAEAAMKYFVMGAVASGMMLFGISLLFGVTGSFDLLTVQQIILNKYAIPVTLQFAMMLLICGLAFKLGAVPFHMWVPDVYQGSPTTVTLLIGTVPKIAAFGMAYRILGDALPVISAEWQPVLILFAVLSMGIGNIVAIAQTNIKRLLAYSTIGHIGFLCLGLLAGPDVGYSSAMFYVLVYTITALAAFGMIVLLSAQGFEAENIDDFKGLGAEHPFLGFLMLIIMFSLAGVPPTVGFYAKWMVLRAVIDANLLWLAIVAVLFSVIGAFYYLRVVKVIFFDKPAEDQLLSPTGMTVAGVSMLTFNALLVLILGVMPAPLMQLCMSVIN